MADTEYGYHCGANKKYALQHDTHKYLITCVYNTINQST